MLNGGVLGDCRQCEARFLREGQGPYQVPCWGPEATTRCGPGGEALGSTIILVSFWAAMKANLRLFMTWWFGIMSLLEWRGGELL